MLNKELFPLYLSGFLDLFGVSMVIPLLSTHVKELGASSTLVGIIGSLYGGIQLFSSPIIGKWSDVYGRRYCLLWCMVLTSIGYLIPGLDSTILIIIVARVLNGLFKHSQNLTKSLLADITHKDQQSAVLGHFNAASSFGFIVGPLIGGHIAETSNGFSKVSFLGGLIFFTNSVLIYFCVDESKKESHQEELYRSESSTSFKKITSEELDFNPKLLVQTFHSIDWKNLWDLFFIKFCMGFSVILFRSNFSLVMKDTFEVSPVTLGYLISYSGCVSALCGFFVGYIANLYKNDALLMLHMSIFQVFTLFMLSFIQSFWFYVLFLTPLSFITTVSRVAATSLTIQRGQKKEIGTLMGFSQSVMSVARMLAPFVSGVALDFSSAGPSFIGSVVSLIAVIIMIMRPQGNTDKIVKKE